MNQQTVLEEQKILDAFSAYFNQRQDCDFVRSEKLGLFCISMWSLQEGCTYDIVHIQSPRHLGEVIVDMIMNDYLAEKAQNCVSEIDLEQVYCERIEPYIKKIPEYEGIFQEQFHQIKRSAICVKGLK